MFVFAINDFNRQTVQGLFFPHLFGLRLVFEGTNLDAVVGIFYYGRTRLFLRLVRGFVAFRRSGLGSRRFGFHFVGATLQFVVKGVFGLAGAMRFARNRCALWCFGDS